MKAVVEAGIGRFEGLPAGFAAGFTSRLSAPDGLPAEEALRRLGAALGAPGATVARARQVHGRGVLRVQGAFAGGRCVVVGEGDALVTEESGVLVAVASADCVPILLLDSVTGSCAAVHAGWRGTSLRIVDAAVDALGERGVKPEDLVALFGPSISRDRYEVGPEVVTRLREAYAGVPVETGAVRRGAGDRSFVDVAAFNRGLLLARGVREERIISTGLCTASLPDFPSYRRDGGGTGRILTGVVRL